MQPTPRSLHVDGILQEIAIAYFQDAENFVAGRAMPNLPVDKQTDKYRSYDKDNFRRDDMSRWEGGSPPAVLGWGLTDATYDCKGYANDVIITKQQRSNNDGPLELETAATWRLTQAALQKAEGIFMANFFSGSKWGTDKTLSGNDQWSAEATSDPKTDVNLARQTVLKNTGFQPNFGVVQTEVVDQLGKHPMLRDQIKYTSPDSHDITSIARYFKLDTLLEAKASKDSAVENESASEGFVAADNMIVYYAAPVPSMLLPSAGYNFIWKGMSDENDLGISIEVIEDVVGGATRVRGQFAFDLKLTGSDLGYILIDALA